MQLSKIDPAFYISHFHYIKKTNNNIITSKTKTTLRFRTNNLRKRSLLTIKKACNSFIDTITSPNCRDKFL